MTRLYTFLDSYFSTLKRDEEGQATAEYALVIVGATVVAGGLIAFMGGGGPIKSVFSKVIDKVLSGI